MRSWGPGESDIHGMGAFAKESVPTGDMVDYLITGLRGGGLLGGDRTELGRYVNHQSSPNGRMEKIPASPDQYYFKSLSDIGEGSELTIDYNDTPFFVAKPKDIDPDNYESWN